MITKLVVLRHKLGGKIFSVISEQISRPFLSLEQGINVHIHPLDGTDRTLSDN